MYQIGGSIFKRKLNLEGLAFTLKEYAWKNSGIWKKTQGFSKKLKDLAKKTQGFAKKLNASESSDSVWLQKIAQKKPAVGASRQKTV